MINQWNCIEYSIVNRHACYCAVYEVNMSNNFDLIYAFYVMWIRLYYNEVVS